MTKSDLLLGVNMSKPMTVARYAKEHRGWFYGCLLLFALVAFFA